MLCTLAESGEVHPLPFTSCSEMPLKPWACARAGSFIPLYTLRIKNNNRRICQDACRVALHKAHPQQKLISSSTDFAFTTLWLCLCGASAPFRIYKSIKTTVDLHSLIQRVRGQLAYVALASWFRDRGPWGSSISKLEILCLQAIGYKWMAAYAFQMLKGDEGSYRYRCGEQGQRSGFIYADACFSCVFGAPVLVQ